MMADLKRLWQEIREIQATLPEFVWVVEIGHAHPPIEVSAEVAARLFQATSHRLATEEEIGLQRDRGIALNRRRTEDRLRREGIAVVPL
jgi:hypothetical protein